MKNEIKEKIMLFISNKGNIPYREIDGDTDFFSSGIIPSLSIIELFVFLEKTYNISIEGNDLLEEYFKNIDITAEFVFRKIEEQKNQVKV